MSNPSPPGLPPLRGGSGVQLGLLAESHGRPNAGLDRFDSRIRHHGGRVAVPGTRAVGTTVADPVDPFLKLDVVGGDETFPPILGDPARELIVLPHDDRAGFAEGDGTFFTDDFAADVVPVADVD